jgi:hypothetical protein
MVDSYDISWFYNSFSEKQKLSDRNWAQTYCDIKILETTAWVFSFKAIFKGVGDDISASRIILFDTPIL